ncbi:DUF6506 family protein [Brachyspira sp. G79]|uniref:DUF6506 family protein n=1 Tax=Brachyspira sp. G79 TaxID=1358104 RepID=UPI000BBB6FF5|nr:DUF6506 family protein [Brachyspira sp. G79]PCG20323.1 hypothetical protein KQ44_10120 [Brachyspira sp. G79]
MKFAYLIMGKIFDSNKDRAYIHNEISQIIGVSDMEEACKIAKELQNEGVDCIELCGGFGEEGARKIIDATENKIAVGFAVHLEEQNDIYKKLFGR